MPPEKEVRLEDEDDQELLVVPSQIRRRLPALEGLSGEVRAIWSKLFAANAAPVEGDPQNDVYKALMTWYGDNPKLVEAHDGVAKSIGDLARSFDGVADAADKAESYAGETVHDLGKQLPTSENADVPPLQPISVPDPAKPPSPGSTPHSSGPKAGGRH